MSQCSKCGNDLTGASQKNGISKKTGKPWSAFVCPSCQEFNFIQMNKFTKPVQKQQVFQGTQAPKTPAQIPDPGFGAPAATNGKLEMMEKSLTAKMTTILSEITSLRCEVANLKTFIANNPPVIDASELMQEEKPEAKKSMVDWEE